MGPRIVVIDNYDSFVYNLVQYLGELGADPVVVRNDASDVRDLDALRPDGLVVSPGPGRPEDAGVSIEAIRHFGEGGVAVLGVCLGHQCIGQAYGGTVVSAPEIVHGKTSFIHHDGKGVLAGLPEPFEATRYHSLVVDPASLPNELEATAWTGDGVLMGLRHRDLPIEGVQFHPESVLTHVGHELLGNFLHRGRRRHVIATANCRLRPTVATAVRSGHRLSWATGCRGPQVVVANAVENDLTPGSSRSGTGLPPRRD